jgi:hypothetical protein
LILGQPANFNRWKRAMFAVLIGGTPCGRRDNVSGYKRHIVKAIAFSLMISSLGAVT